MPPSPNYLRGGRWILLLFTLPALSQVRVNGWVTTQNEVPVAGARVTMLELSAASGFEAVTDATGYWDLPLPHAGDYSLTVDRAGFYVATRDSVSVPPAAVGQAPLEIRVSLQTIYEIGTTVEVKGQAGLANMDQVTPGTTLSSRTLYDVPFPNQNSLRSGLRMIPGVVQDLSGGIHLYGGSEEQAQYGFEGFRLNDPLTGRFDARMSLEAIESVDAQPSPTDAAAGPGDAGTLLLHARTGSDTLHFSGAEYFPSIGSGRIANWTPRAYVSGPWWKRRAWFFNTGELQFVRATFRDLPRSQDSSKNWRVNDLLHNQINLTERNIITAGLLYDYQFSRYGGLSDLDARSTTQRRESGQWFGYAKDQWIFSSTSMIEFGFAASQEHSVIIPQAYGTYLITPSGQQGDYYADWRRDAKRYEGIVNYNLPTFHAWGEHQLKTGVDIVHLQYAQNVTRTAIDYLNNAGDVLRSITFAGSGALSLASDVRGFYLQDSWRVRSWLLLQYGVRADEDGLLNRVSWSPRAGVAISPPGLSNFRFSGSFARTIDAANLAPFTRPLDQSAISTYYNAAGNVILGPVTSVFVTQNNLNTPRADVWTLAAERSFPKMIRGKVQLLRRRYSRGFDDAGSLPEQDQLSAILAGAPNPGPLVELYNLTNQRQDSYDSAEVSFGQPLNGRFQWMVSYTRSRAESNAVIDRSIDQPLSVSSDTGPLPWDAPNRLLTWGYVPAWSKSYSIGYMLDWHTGLPFSLQDPYGQLVGAADSRRFPDYFEFNLFLERLLSVRRYRVAVRLGLNNITNHFNPVRVDNVVGSPIYLSEYGVQPRSLNVALRFIDRH